MSDASKQAPSVNGFITPNDVIDKYMSIMPPVAFKCYMVVLRKTVGWQKTSDKISLSQFVEATGNEKSTCSEALNWLAEAGFILREIVPGKLTTYSLNRKENAVISLPEKRKHSKGCPPRRTVEVSAQAEGVSAQAEGGVRLGGSTINNYTNNTSTKVIPPPKSPKPIPEPNDRFPDESVEEVFAPFIAIYRSRGGEVPVRNATAEFNRLVLKMGRVEEFALGLQNYLNNKIANEQTRLKNFDVYIREGLWEGHTEVMEGPVSVPGAPEPIESKSMNAFDLAVEKAKLNGEIPA